MAAVAVQRKLGQKPDSAATAAKSSSLPHMVTWPNNRGIMGWRGRGGDGHKRFGGFQNHHFGSFLGGSAPPMGRNWYRLRMKRKEGQEEEMLQ